jgi:hypothetical protein
VRTNSVELYDLENDRLEKHNLKTKHSDFKKLYNEFKDAKTKPYRRLQKDLDKKTKKILKSLGYIE